MMISGESTVANKDGMCYWLRRARRPARRDSSVAFGQIKFVNKYEIQDGRPPLRAVMFLHERQIRIN
jgi:hypothetical protein